MGVVLAMAASPLLSGCVAMASQKNMEELAEARRIAEASEAELQACKDRRAQLERDLAAKKKTLSEWQNRKSEVQKGLETWGQ
jgi:septal ring factor EnvC (AmiA/AmiB activator)